VIWQRVRRGNCRLHLWAKAALASALGYGESCCFRAGEQGRGHGAAEQPCPTPWNSIPLSSSPASPRHHPWHPLVTIPGIPLSPSPASPRHHPWHPLVTIPGIPSPPSLASPCHHLQGPLVTIPRLRASFRALPWVWEAGFSGVSGLTSRILSPWAAPLAGTVTPRHEAAPAAAKPYVPPQLCIPSTSLANG